VPLMSRGGSTKFVMFAGQRGVRRNAVIAEATVLLTSLRPNAGAPGLFAGIVGRVHICYCERALTVDLDHSVLWRPRVMVHVRRRFTKTSSAELDTVLLIELVTHSDMELAGNDSHVF
jgi:hypothetical protein